MSLLGTIASAIGGAFIGIIYFLMSYFVNNNSNYNLYSQYPMILVGLVCGLLGSLIDSILGATLQATYYCTDKKKIVKNINNNNNNKSIIIVSGVNFLSNEAVNIFSILITMILSLFIGPYIFCICDNNQCYEYNRIINLFF